MTDDLKKRLIGAAVLVSLAVIFIPMLIEEETVIDSGIYKSNIPEKTISEFSKPAFAEKEIEKSEADTDFGTTIMPSVNTEVKTIVTTKAVDAESQSNVTAVTTRTGLSSWMIQVGAFSSQDNADKVVEQLRKAGYDTHLETAQVNTKKVFRVRVGPEVDRGKADTMAKAISKKFFLSAKVIRYP